MIAEIIFGSSTVANMQGIGQFQVCETFNKIFPEKRDLSSECI